MVGILQNQYEVYRNNLCYSHKPKAEEGAGILYHFFKYCHQVSIQIITKYC